MYRDEFKHQKKNKFRRSNSFIDNFSSSINPTECFQLRINQKKWPSNKDGGKKYSTKAKRLKQLINMIPVRYQQQQRLRKQEFARKKKEFLQQMKIGETVLDQRVNEKLKEKTNEVVVQNQEKKQRNEQVMSPPRENKESSMMDGQANGLTQNSIKVKQEMKEVKAEEKKENISEQHQAAKPVTLEHRTVLEKTQRKDEDFINKLTLEKQAIMKQLKNLKSKESQIVDKISKYREELIKYAPKKYGRFNQSSIGFQIKKEYLDYRYETVRQREERFAWFWKKVKEIDLMKAEKIEDDCVICYQQLDTRVKCEEIDAKTLTVIEFVNHLISKSKKQQIERKNQDNADLLSKNQKKQQTSQQQIVQLYCGHMFHKKCIHQWLRNNPQCAICRRDFRIHSEYAKWDVEFRRRILSSNARKQLDRLIEKQEKNCKAEIEKLQEIRGLIEKQEKMLELAKENSKAIAENKLIKKI